ncbi:hypothetical protein BS50DRAFT_569945 [Corynespora cassiicola Philippines]|uniref:Uncharacterized protein n=1 Tax=Corynespora cassiicola Philippines TaxID=1448308 RepID=A0A2T2P449_CORCC|nr:hypothetical protein BS50DRAFT_569945 [Corynespora cassiicola Philippines]
MTEKAIEDSSFEIEKLSEKEKQELIASDAVSVISGTTLGAADLAFQPAKSLHINTKGIPWLRFPLPPSELQTSIHNPDGSIAYNSTRSTRSSGSCVLTDADGRQLLGTTYFFGPNRDPILTRLDVGGGPDNEIKTLSKWTSRSQVFVLPDGRTFEWEYKKEKGFGNKGDKGTALIMSMQGRRIAVLVRNDDTRTSGSKSCSAGNGGELILGETVGGMDGLSEEIVVATCLLMLKKEVDRRRFVQILIISGGAT